MSAVGAAVLEMLPSIINAGTSIYTTNKTNQSNEDIARYASDQDYKKWREYVDLVDPKNQVARLRAAGMNPAIAMGNGAIDSGNPTSMAPETKVPTYDYSPIAQGMRDSCNLR